MKDEGNVTVKSPSRVAKACAGAATDLTLRGTLLVLMAGAKWVADGFGIALFECKKARSSSLARSLPSNGHSRGR